MEIIEFNESIITDANVDKALELHSYLGKEIASFTKVEKAIGKVNPNKVNLITTQQKVQDYLVGYFSSKRDSSKQAVTSATELLQRRKLKQNKLDANGSIVKIDMVDIGLKFIHDHFNNGNLFPLCTFFTMVAGSGVGKSDYLYKMADSFLLQGYKVLLCSFEIGEDRLSTILDSRENGGKDRMRASREAELFDNLFINYYARDIESLRLMCDIAVQQGVKCILIDSFGEIERSKQEYNLQLEVAMMLNAVCNDYGIFISLISQVKANEDNDSYTMRGGEDFKYKPDLSIHISKLSPTDTSGDRKIHLFKNREADINGKTIITHYNFETRDIEFKCNLEDLPETLSDGSQAKKLKFGKKS
jgi:hypothetical protein